MAWSFVAASSAVATGANPAPAVPTGYAANDILIIVASSSAVYSATPPTGYTQLVRNTAAAPFLAAWWKTAGASESAPSITNADTSSKATLLCYRNSSGTDVTGAIATGTTTATTTTTVTTTAKNDLVLNVFGGGKTSSSTGSWSGGSANSRVSSGTSTTLCGVFCTDELQAAAGTTTARTGTLSRASTGTQGVTLSFKSSAHTTTGVLTGQGSTIVGTAKNFTVHPSSGAVTGQLGTTSGTATRFRAHGSSGITSGQLGAVVGAAQHSAPSFVTHPSSGALLAQGSVVVGVAAHKVTHSSSGGLLGQLGSIGGVAQRFRAHSASGTTAGSLGSVAGTAAHYRQMLTAGALVGQGATLSGTALRSGAPLDHTTIGSFSGQLGSLSGVAVHTAQNTQTGHSGYSRAFYYQLQEEELKKYEQKQRQEAPQGKSEVPPPEPVATATPERAATEPAIGAPQVHPRPVYRKPAKQGNIEPWLHTLSSEFRAWSRTTRQAALSMLANKAANDEEEEIVTLLLLAA